MTKRKDAPTIKYVQQKHDKGCLVACIAMVLGCEYDDVAREFKNDFDKKGMDGQTAKEFICEHRHSVIEKRGTHYGDVREHNDRMMVPFAPIHIVCAQQFKDEPKHRHAFVMGSKGQIYDPHSEDMKDAAFYEIVHVMGFWKD